MPLTIADQLVTLTGDGTIQPMTRGIVSAAPSSVPIFVTVGGTAYEIQGAGPKATSDPSGHFTLVLPWNSECEPNNLTWELTTPDGTTWGGTVPEGVSGPVTVKTLKDTYGWGLVVGPASGPINVVQGPQGIAGASASNLYLAAQSQGEGLTLNGIQYPLAGPKLPTTNSGIHLANPIGVSPNAGGGELCVGANPSLRGPGPAWASFYYTWGRDGGGAVHGLFTANPNSIPSAVTSIVANGSTWVVTAPGHNLLVNSVASISGFTGSNGPAGYNVSNQQVVAVTSSTYTINNSATPGAITNYSGVTTVKTWGETVDWWVRHFPNYCLWVDTAGTNPNPFGYPAYQVIPALDYTIPALQTMLIGWFITLLSPPYNYDGLYLDNGMAADWFGTALYSFSGAAGTYPGSSGLYTLKWGLPNANDFVTGYVAAQLAAFQTIYQAVKNACPGKSITMNNSIMGFSSQLTSDWLSVYTNSWDILHDEPGFTNNSASGSPNVNITGITTNGTTWTATCDGTTGMSAGNTVVIAGCSNTGYNGTFVVASASSNQFTITNSTQPGASATWGSASAWPMSNDLSLPFTTNGSTSQVPTHLFTKASYFQTMQKAGKGLTVGQPIPYRGIYRADLSAPTSVAVSIPVNWTSDVSVSAAVINNRKCWMDWILATYLLVKAHHTWLWMNVNQRYSVPIPLQTEYTTAQSIGEPTSDFYDVPGYSYLFDNGAGGAGAGTAALYARDYTGGLIVISADQQVWSESNPANATNRYQVDLTQLGPTPGAYKDLWGIPAISSTFPLHVPGNTPGGSWLRAAAVLLS